MQRQEVIAKCLEMGIPILHGRIDKTLFATSLQQMAATPLRAHRLSGPAYVHRPSRG